MFQISRCLPTSASVRSSYAASWPGTSPHRIFMAAWGCVKSEACWNCGTPWSHVHSKRYGEQKDSNITKKTYFPSNLKNDTALRIQRRSQRCGLARSGPRRKRAALLGLGSAWVRSPCPNFGHGNHREAFVGLFWYTYTVHLSDEMTWKVMTTPGSCQFQFALVLFAKHESRYTRPLEEVVSKVAQAQKRTDTSNFLQQWQVNIPRCLDRAQNVFATLGRGVFVHWGQGPNTHLIGGQLSGDATTARSWEQLAIFICNSIQYFQNSRSAFTLWLLRFQHIEFDLIFIDGNHAYEASPFRGTSVPSVYVLKDLCFCFNNLQYHSASILVHVFTPEAVKLDMLLCLQMATPDLSASRASLLVRLGAVKTTSEVGVISYSHYVM